MHQFPGWLVRRCARLAALVLLAIPVQAAALSCVGLDDRYLVECDSRECQVRFRARDVSTGGCGRRTVVEDVSADVALLITKRLAASLAPGRYEITLTHRYYGPPPISADMLARSLDAGEFRAPRIQMRSLPQGTELAHLRTDWEDRALSSLLAHYARWAVDLALLAIGLAAMIVTMAVFRKRLLGKVTGSLVRPIVGQIGLFAICAVLLVGSPSGALLIGLVAPLLLLVWVWEAAMFLWVAYRRRRPREA